MNVVAQSFLLLVATFASAQTQQHSAVCVYGKKNFTGPADASANISVSALHDGVEINVYVADDVNIVGNNVLKSDHIEIWMAMDTIVRQGNVFDGNMYNSIGEGDLTFLDFLKERQGYRGPLKENATEKDVKSDVDFTGMRHWAIDLQNNSVLLLDTEKYYGFSTLDSTTTSSIEVIKSKTENGYQYTIHLSPESIGFSASPQMKNLYYMVDVFDIDQGGAVSVLSSNPKRKWGDPNTFAPLHFSIPIELSIDQNPDNVVRAAFYVVQKNNKTQQYEWQCFYPNPQMTSTFSTFERTHYSRIDFESEFKALSDGSVVEKRFYNGPMISVTRFGKHVYTYSTISDDDERNDPVDIEFVSTGKYAVKIESFVPHNLWGVGQCGACVDGHVEFIILDKGEEHPIYNIDFTDEQMSMEYKGKTLNGHFREARWTQNFSVVEFFMQLYSTEETENKDDDTCLLMLTRILPYYDLSENVEIVKCP